MPVSLTDDYPDGSINGGACWLCNAAPREFQGKRERIIDLNRHIDYEGFALICETCGIEIGRLLGMATADDVNELGRRIAAAEDALLTAEGRAAEAEDVVISLRRYDEHRKSEEDTHMAEAMAMRVAAEVAPPKPKPRPRAKATA